MEVPHSTGLVEPRLLWRCPQYRSSGAQIIILSPLLTMTSLSGATQSPNKGGEIAVSTLCSNRATCRLMDTQAHVQITNSMCHTYHNIM